MKHARTVLYNFIAVLLLFSLIEGICRFKSGPFIEVPAHTDVLKERMKNEKLDGNSLAAEFGSASRLTPPETSRSHPDESLKSYNYSEIDQSPIANRQWTISADGETRSSRFIKKIKGTGKEVYNVLYRLNRLDKRAVENLSPRTKQQSFVLAAGDSYTFGEGVNQGLDYPSQLSARLGPKWFVYNYGISGDSANDFYFRTGLDPQFFSQITQQSGTFIWVYNDAQMQRLIYPTSAYKFSFIAGKAEYTLDDDEIVFHGFFNNTSRPMRKLIDGLSHLAMIKSFNLEVPRVFTKNHYQLFMRLLNSSLASMEQSGHFFNKKILVLYTANNNVGELKKAAIENGFEVLDFEKLLYKRDIANGGDLNLSLPVDGHPSPEAYWLLSAVLEEKFFR